MPETIPIAAPAAPATAPGAEDRHPGVSKLLEMLVNDPEVAPAEPKLEHAPSKAAEPKPTTPATPAVDDKPIRARQRPAPAAPIRPALPIDLPTAAPVPSARQTAAPEEELELLPNEKQDQADAEYAERHLGPEYAGLGARVKKFHRDHAAYTNRPDFEPDSPEYREWLATNQPKLTDVQHRAIMEAQITEKAQQKARSEVGHIEHELYVRDTEPTVKAEGDRIYAELADLALPKEIKDILAEPAFAKDSNAGWAEAKKYHQLEIQTTHNVISNFKGDVEELERISRKHPKTGQSMISEAILPTDPKFVQHQRIRNLVAEMCDDFKRSNEPQQKDGKWFVTREEYQNLPAQHRPSYWTFSNKDVIARAKSKIPGVVSQTIKRHIDEQTARGFVRQPRQVTPPAAPRSTPSAPAAPRPSAIPTGAAPGTETLGSKLAAALAGNR